MFISKSKKLTKEASAFLVPTNSTHRQYEALRSFFVEESSSREAAVRFGYTEGSFRLLCYQFRQNLKRQFFLPSGKGPQEAPKTDPVRARTVAMRKQNLSIYDIRQALEDEGKKFSAVTIHAILKEEGFARLPRRTELERPISVRPMEASVADVRQLDLSPRRFRTKFGGLFLFLPYLAEIPLQKILANSGFPGTEMVSAAHAIRALLALKLFGNARHSHVMGYVFDEGLALFAGLNVTPKRSFLTEYSCRIPPSSYPKFMKQWFNAMNDIGLERGVSFDLDFHTIPFHGEDALVEKHYVSKRSRKQKGILAFLAQDAGKHVFCYINANIRRGDQNDEILRFTAFWKERTGKLPEELIFDSKLTTYSNLSRINQMGIRFMTLRRRSRSMLHEAYQIPISAWRQIQLPNLNRAYRTPKILDQQISLPGYDGKIRQIIITDLGHEEPTFLLTNQTRSAPKLITRYAQRMLIENNIADGIDFFHMDALSSSVAMKVDCDLQLTLMASSLYRLLAAKIGNGYTTAKSRHLFRDFIDATAQVTINNEEIIVQFQKRAHNPLLISAGFDKKNTVVPWLGKKRLRLVFG